MVEKSKHPYFREYLDHLILERGAAKATVDAYQRDIIQHLAYLNKQKILFPNNVTSEVFIDYIEELRAQGFQPTSLARKNSSLRRFYRYLQNEGYITEDPCRLSPSPRMTKRFKSAIKQEEVEKLIEAVEQEKNECLRLRDHAMLEFLYATGLRVSELLGLRPGDFDFYHLYVRVMGKGSKERLVPFHDLAADRIKEYLKRSRPALCVRKPGGNTLC